MDTSLTGPSHAPSTMPAVTIATGVTAIALGIGLAVAAHLRGSHWATAAIPAYVGVVFVALGLAARNVSLRRHLIHLAAALALLLVLGGFGMAVPKILANANGTLPATTTYRPLAAWGQVALAVVMLVYVVLAVRSFIAAKRWRQSNG